MCGRRLWVHAPCAQPRFPMAWASIVSARTSTAGKSIISFGNSLSFSMHVALQHTEIRPPQRVEGAASIAARRLEAMLWVSLASKSITTMYSKDWAGRLGECAGWRSLATAGGDSVPKGSCYWGQHDASGIHSSRPCQGQCVTPLCAHCCSLTEGLREMLAKLRPNQNRNASCPIGCPSNSS